MVLNQKATTAAKGKVESANSKDYLGSTGERDGMARVL